MSKARIKNNPDPYFGVEEAAEFLGETPRWIRRAVEERRIRHTHHGRLLKFRRSWLIEYSDGNVVEPEQQS